MKLYQKIIIFSPSLEKDFIAQSFPNARDRQKYLDFFERHAKKITFAGYLLPQHGVVRDDENNNLPKPKPLKGACRVAVLRGGGAVYPKLIAEAIRASDLLGKEYHLTVVAGPSTTRQEWDFFVTLLDNKKINNVVLHSSVGNYEKLIEDSDLCVAMSGYHTSAMLIKHQKKSIIVPFEGNGILNFHEQSARALLLKNIIGAKILLAQDLSKNNLAEAVKDAAASPKRTSQGKKEWFTGTKVLDQSLIGLFGR